MQKKKIPCQTGEACSSCWNSDACQLYKYRKKEQQEKEQKGKERLENEQSEQIERVINIGINQITLRIS